MNTSRLTQSQFTSVDGNPSCSTTEESSSISDRIDDVGSASFSLSKGPSQGILKIGERRLREKRKVKFDEKTVFIEREENPTKAIKYSYKAQLANFRFCSSYAERIKYFELIRRFEAVPSLLKGHPYIDTPLFRNRRPIPYCVRELKPQEKKTDDCKRNQLKHSRKDSPVQQGKRKSGLHNEFVSTTSFPFDICSEEERVADSAVSYLFCLCKINFF